MTRKTIIGLALLIAAFGFAAGAGMHLFYGQNRYWADNGNLRTDGVIESWGTSNGLTLWYEEAISDTLHLSSAGVWTVARPIAQATTLTVAATGTQRAIYGKFTTAAAMTSGTLAGVRGEITVPSNATVTGSSNYLYGTQGKLIGDTSTIDAGSGHVCAVMAQISLSGATITSGHVAGLIVSGQYLPTSSYVDMIYLESGGYAVNSAIKAVLNANYVLDYSPESTPGNGAFSLSGSCTTPGVSHGWLKIKVNGSDRYIPLSAAVS